MPQAYPYMATQVRFFFGVFEECTEFEVLGFNKECYEDVGGNQIESD